MLTRLVERMRTAQKRDQERAHELADAILVAALRRATVNTPHEAAAKELIALYRSRDKWYA